jgi:hypothetical protein
VFNVKAQDPWEAARFNAWDQSGDIRAVDPRVLAREREFATAAGYYADNERYLTAADAAEVLMSMSTEELAATKLQMMALVPGYTDKDAGSLFIRSVNKQTLDAYWYMVGEAQLNDMKPAAYAQQQIAAGINYNADDSGGGGGGGGGSVDTIRLTNPDDLKAVANQVAQQRLGRFLSDDELNRFVSSFQAQETAFQQAYYADQAVVTEAPAADTAASTWIDQTRKVDADIYAIGSQLDTFLNMMGG